MAGKKIIYFAFANSSTRPLQCLQSEFNYLKELFRNANKEGHFTYEMDPFASIESVNLFLSEHKDDIAVFQFSGHAGGDAIELFDKPAFGEGLVEYLSYATRKGNLRLVILNGCSTRKLVDMLHGAGIPVVIGTNASINDSSAEEFSKCFWRSTLKHGKQISQSFNESLAAAALVNSKIQISKAREIGFGFDSKETGLWCIKAKDNNGLQISAVPYEMEEEQVEFVPNEMLFQTLYEEFYRANNPKVKKLYDSNNATKGEKLIAIVNSIPFPIGKPLQMLLCDSQSKSGCDRININRIRQIGQLYQTTTEFLCFIMFAQLWEIILRYPNVEIEPGVKKVIVEYFKAEPQERNEFKYIPLIRTIREFIESLSKKGWDLKEDEKKLHRDISLFIDEQFILKDLFVDGNEFADSCEYLWTLHYNASNDLVAPGRVSSICKEAEENLCIFLKHISFVHRYQLTSVQNIDILKYRHTPIKQALYKHRVVPLMEAVGSAEHNYYLMPTFLDNWGVVLIKGNISSIDDKSKMYNAEIEDFLNLSPFVIDRNAFLKNADLPDLMFFKSYFNDPQRIEFKKVAHPDNANEVLVVDSKKSYEPIRLEIDAFFKLLQ